MGFWSKKKEKAELDAAVAAAAKPATALIVQPAQDETRSPMGSHFGGAPYAEEGETWPVWTDGRPYDFVCQLNLAEFSECPATPFDLITVFACTKAHEEGDLDGMCLVRSYTKPSASKLAPLERPSPLEEFDYEVQPCSIQTDRSVTYPWKPEVDPAVRIAASRFWDPLSAYYASLRRLGCRDQYQWFSRVGGYPAWVQENTLEYDDLVFLCQIEYEVAANNCYQDAAPIYVAFSPSEPGRIEVDASQCH